MGAESAECSNEAKHQAYVVLTRAVWVSLEEENACVSAGKSWREREGALTAQTLRLTPVSLYF